MSPAGDVAHQRTLVEREKVTVTEQEMVVSMMVTEDVDQVLYAGATTAESLAHTTMRKMIAVRGLLEVHPNQHLSRVLNRNYALGNHSINLVSGSDWGPWGEWTSCSRSGIRTREQKCNGRECSLGNGRVGKVNTQERYCFARK